MAQKKLMIADVGEITLQKRKGARNIRLSVSQEGIVRVSMPVWSPYKVGAAFALSKTEWIKKQRLGKQVHIFKENDRIGKGHRLRFVYEQRLDITGRVTASEVIIKLPLRAVSEDADVQKAVKKAAFRALKQEATLLLPPRLKELALKYGFSYRSVSVKQLKTRWGSCSSQKDIALNCFLVQLPWELIDYVILHELLHTQIMAHGRPFWDELGHYVPNLHAKRVAIRGYQPALIAAI